MVSAEADNEGQHEDAGVKTSEDVQVEDEEDPSQAPVPTDATALPDQAVEARPDEPEPGGVPSSSSEDQSEQVASSTAAEVAELPSVLADQGKVDPSVEQEASKSDPEPVVVTAEASNEELPQQETSSADQAGELKAAKDETQEEEQREREASASKRNGDCPPYVESSSSGVPGTSSEEATTELQAAQEEPAQDENPPPDNDEEADAELTPQQSSESLTAKPPGFLESLTASFAPDTKAAWAQIFGPRYDEGDEDGGVQADNPSAANSPRDSVASRSSLQAKLDRERKLDEQIQASQRRYRERVLRTAAANKTALKRSQGPASRRPQQQTPITSPFEQAGLSLTQVRFCTEKALDETCKCFRRLHAVALEEAEEAGNAPVQGVFATQWELDHLLRELFDPQEVADSSSRGRKGTLAAPLGFEQAGSEGISLNTQLQASWFVPFGQLPQLRSLVMKITKRHLNEDKLAIVNRHLQRQLTLLPLSLKLQSLVIQLSNQKMKEPIDVPLRQQLRSPEDVAQELAACLAVSGASTSEDYTNLLLFLPVELVAKTQVSSLVGAQRLVFFRFLIEIVAAERSRLSSKSTESLPPALPQQTRAKRKSIASKRARSSSKSIPAERTESEDTGQDGEKPVGREDTGSLRAANGSLPSPEEAAVEEAPEDDSSFHEPNEVDPVGDECEKPASRLQQQLEAAIAQLRRTLATIDSDIDADAKIYALNPATRATYLAAVACHESVLLLLENNIDVDATMSDKVRHFIEALQAIQLQANDHVCQAPVDNHSRDPPRFPPPYPESTAPAESEEGEGSTAQAQFPPPYTITTPSYWAFSPSLPEPKSSIAKLAKKSPSNKAADLRSHFMSKESPGVGAYNIQQGERLTFQQTPSFSFGSKDDGAGPDSSLPKGNTRSSFRQRMKTSLAFGPPPEDDKDLPSDRASQYDDPHLRATATCELADDFPPHYNDGDANVVPEETSEAAQNGETEMDRALRLQQRIFMDEFVQQVVSNQGSPSYFVPRNTETPSSRQSKPKSKPYWATSEVSPGMERLLQRQRRAPKPQTAAPSFNPVKPRASKRTTRKPAPVPPPRQQLDNDQHLAWAARISELYQPTE